MYAQWIRARSGFPLTNAATSVPRVTMASGPTSRASVAILCAARRGASWNGTSVPSGASAVASGGWNVTFGRSWTGLSTRRVRSTSLRRRCTSSKIPESISAIVASQMEEPSVMLVLTSTYRSATRCSSRRCTRSLREDRDDVERPVGCPRRVAGLRPGGEREVCSAAQLGVEVPRGIVIVEVDHEHGTLPSGEEEVAQLAVPAAVGGMQRAVPDPAAQRTGFDDEEGRLFLQLHQIWAERAHGVVRLQLCDGAGQRDRLDQGRLRLLPGPLLEQRGEPARALGIRRDGCGDPSCGRLRGQVLQRLRCRVFGGRAAERWRRGRRLPAGAAPEAHGLGRLFDPGDGAAHAVQVLADVAHRGLGVRAGAGEVEDPGELLLLRLAGCHDLV